MGQRKIAGLINRNGIWHIDKQVFGKRIRESTGTGDRAQAEAFLAYKIEESRQATVYGVRPKRDFRLAAAKFLTENTHKASISKDALLIRQLDSYIGDLELDTIHMGTMDAFIKARRKDGVKTRTINHGLKVVRRILNLAAYEWIDENGLSWLLSAPRIKMLPENDLRKPYPLSWEEQERLFAKLPLHIRRMALFAVNTGCRDAEICALRWEWEVNVPELQNRSVFMIPAERVKNREERLVILNDIATNVVDSVRGIHPEYVFSFRQRGLRNILNTGWKKARVEADLKHVRVHDLKHTFGRRLRAAGVSFEDRQDLLGHKSGRITTHYSAAELQNLFDAANKVCINKGNTPVLTLLKRSK